MRMRSFLLVILAVLVVAACDSGDAELSTSSTILTSPSVTSGPITTTTVDTGPTDGDEAPPTSLVGEPVGSYQVVERIPVDEGEMQIIVIPDGGYTDIDLENFVLDLLEQNPDLYGAEVFSDAAAAEAFQVPSADRTDAEQEQIDENHLVTLVGRESIQFQGPMSEFPGGAIGS